jgi:hypothetical protein
MKGTVTTYSTCRWEVPEILRAKRDGYNFTSADAGGAAPEGLAACNARLTLRPSLFARAITRGSKPQVEEVVTVPLPGGRA